MSKNYSTGTNTRLSIINACKELFYENGYLATTVTDICKLSKTNRGTAFYHFNNWRSDIKTYFGYRVYNDAMSQCYAEAASFCIKDKEIEEKLGELFFWHKFFADDKYARFMAEAASLNNFMITNMEYDLTFHKVSNYLPEEPYSLNQEVAMGAENKLIEHVYKNKDKFNLEYTFLYANKIYCFFAGIPDENEKNEKALKLYKQLDLSSLIYEFKESVKKE